MAERRWEYLSLERLEPHELFFAALGESISSEDWNAGDRLEDKIKARLLLQPLYGHLYSTVEQVDTIRHTVVRSEARDEVIGRIVGDVQDETRKIVKDMLSIDLKIDTKLENVRLVQHQIGDLSQQVGNFFSDLFEKLGEAMRCISEATHRIASFHKARLSILGALNSVYGENSPHRLYPNYLIGLDGTIIRNRYDVSICSYFCYQRDEDQKIEISDAILRVSEELSKLDGSTITEICKHLQSDTAKKKGFGSTCRVIASKCPSLSRDKDCMNVLGEQLLPVVLSQGREMATVEELENVFKAMFQENALFEIEVFRRIVNLGYLAIPRAKIYRNTSENNTYLIGECDILAIGDEDSSFILVEVTTRKSLDEKIQKLNELSNRLGETGIKVDKLFVCDKEEASLGEKSVTFEKLDKLESVLRSFQDE